MTSHQPPAAGDGNKQGSPRHAAIAESKPAQSKREGLRSILSTILILLLAPLIALVLITFVFQSYLVDGPSMEQTLSNSDRLIVWKVPRTWARITGQPYIPDRGDIVVFTEPDIATFGQNPDKQLIKRVIGLPGERVVINNGTVTVYNDVHPEGFNPDTTSGYQLSEAYTPGNTDLTLSDSQIFVLGDNRSNSLDSPDFGPVQADHIVGKLTMRVFPIGEVKRF